MRYRDGPRHEMHPVPLMDTKRTAEILALSDHVEEEDDLLCFAGVYKGTSDVLLGWRGMAGLEVLRKNQDGKLAGFGGASIVSKTSDGVTTLLLGCGITKSLCHVWKLVLHLGRQELDELVYWGKCSCSTSVSALGWGGKNGTTLVLVNGYDSRRVETFEIPTNESPASLSFKRSNIWNQNLFERLTHMKELPETFLSGVKAVMGSSESLQALMDRDCQFRNPAIPMDIQTWIDLFPPTLMDEELYDGAVDSYGKPNGHGKRYFKAENAQYVGQWLNGMRHGCGKMIVLGKEIALDRVVYDGMYNQDARSGWGKEIIDSESYDGQWKDDSRHGFGRLEVLTNCKIGGEPAKVGDSFEGFLKNNRLHGIVRCVYPAGRFPNMDPHIRVASLAKCQLGVRYSEFWYHAQGSPQGFALLRETPTGAFAIRNDMGVPLLGTHAKCGRGAVTHTCWVCLDTKSTLAALASFHRCDTCGFVAHVASKCFISGKCPFTGCQGADMKPFSVKPKIKIVEDEEEEEEENQEFDNVLKAAKRPYATTSRDFAAEAIAAAMAEHIPIRSKAIELCEQRGIATLKENRNAERAERGEWQRDLAAFDQTNAGLKIKLAAITMQLETIRKRPCVQAYSALSEQIFKDKCVTDLHGIADFAKTAMATWLAKPGEGGV